MFPGSPLSVNQALGILFAWFGAFPGISKEALGQLLFLLHHYLLPSGNKIPSSYAAASSATKSMLNPVQDYHCCINDCIIFRGSTDGLETCPVCNEPRYAPGTKVPRKKFRYLPLSPRLHRLFGSAHTSQLLQSHNACGEKKSIGRVMDIHQTQLWNNLYSSDGVYHGDPRGISLGICADGLNPFSRERVNYSMWPIVLSILNLPRHLRNLPGSLLLSGIIPGKKEPKSVDPYLDLLVEELIEVNGMRCWDSHRNEEFHLQATIQLHVLDYPGQNKVFHCQGWPDLWCNYGCAIVCVCIYTINKILPSNQNFS